MALHVCCNAGHDGRGVANRAVEALPENPGCCHLLSLCQLSKEAQALLHATQGPSQSLQKATARPLQVEAFLYGIHIILDLADLESSTRISPTCVFT